MTMAGKGSDASGDDNNVCRQSTWPCVDDDDYDDDDGSGR